MFGKSWRVHYPRHKHFVNLLFFGKIESDKKIFCIDINKCRKNILYYGEYYHSVFTVFDKIEIFNGTTIVPAGGPVKFDFLTGREPHRAASAQLTLIIRPVACSHPAGGVRTGPPPAGATGRHDATRTRAPAGSGHSAITDHVTMSVQVTAFGLRTSTFRTARREPASGPGPCPLTAALGVNGLLKPCTWPRELAIAHRSNC